MTVVASKLPRVGPGLLAGVLLMVNAHAQTPASGPGAGKDQQKSAAPAGAKDNVQLDPAIIKGQQGLPKVLNIVPWKRPGGGDMPGRPGVSLIDEALSPLDRGEMRRELRYQHDLEGAGGSSSTTEGQ